MSELVDRAKASLALVINNGSGTWAVEGCTEMYAVIPELIAEIERLEGESAHWKALWRGTVEDSTKVIQERDEALRALDKVTESWKRLVEGGSDE